MHRIFYIFLIFAVSAVAQSTYPQDLELSWDNPTSFDDGTLLLASDLASIHVSCFRNADTTPVFAATVPALLPGALQTEVFVGVIPQPGNYACVAYAITDQDVWSLASNEALKRYTGKPNPPKNFKFK